VSDGAFAKKTSFDEDTCQRKDIEAVSTKVTKAAGYFSFSYSALACLRMGMSGSASFQSARTLCLLS
jgi:hypothetical protein